LEGVSKDTMPIPNKLSIMVLKCLSFCFLATPTKYRGNKKIKPSFNPWLKKAQSPRL
jgi:hypothetical protein